MNKEKRPANLAVVIFAGLSILGLILPVSPLVHSVRVLLSYGVYPVLDYGHAFEFYIRGVPKNLVLMLQADQENRKLRQQIKDASIIKAKIDAADEENRRLRRLIGVAEVFRWDGTWARIIERDPSHWYGSFLINKGSSDDIVLNAVVIGMEFGHAGLIGRITEVSSRVSKVLLITADLSSVTCYVRPGRWEGLMEGQNSQYLRLNYMPMEAKVSKGAELLTSPSSTVFPSGISIGTISKFYPKESFMTFLSAEIVPTVDPNAIKEVFVFASTKIQ